MKLLERARREPAKVRRVRAAGVSPPSAETADGGQTPLSGAGCSRVEVGSGPNRGYRQPSGDFGPEGRAVCQQVGSRDRTAGQPGPASADRQRERGAAT